MTTLSVKETIISRSPKQREALDHIAIGMDKHWHQNTIASLLNKGLIESEEQEMRFNDGLPAMIVKRYFCPIHVHINWAELCSEEYEGDEDV